MKRQRDMEGRQNAKAGKTEGAATSAATRTNGKRKSKKAVEKIEEDKKSCIGGESSTAVSQENLLGPEDQQPCLWSVVDEQMSWGSIWLPIWDVEYMGEANHSKMFSDVVWDDDIWNLKSIDTVPGNGKGGV